MALSVPRHAVKTIFLRILKYSNNSCILTNSEVSKIKFLYGVRFSIYCQTIILKIFFWKKSQNIYKNMMPGGYSSSRQNVSF